MAILGAPVDELVSDRPGARFGPRAIRAASAQSGPHLEAGIDPLSELRVLDFGDAAVLPADPVRSHAAIEHAVAAIVSAGAVPLSLGGDHSISEPAISACARAHGPLALVHFDAHTDTARRCLGVTLSHGTPMFRLVEAGLVDPSRYVQIGLRGYWPGEAALAWQSEQGITAFLMRDLRERGLEYVLAQTLEQIGTARAYLTVDVDVLDPRLCPRDRHP